MLVKALGRGLLIMPNIVSFCISLFFRYEQPTKAGIGAENIGNKMLQKMGWTAGLGLGKSNQGRTAPVEVIGGCKNVCLLLVRRVWTLSFMWPWLLIWWPFFSLVKVRSFNLVILIFLNFVVDILHPWKEVGDALMPFSCLESQGCHLILFFSSLLFFCRVLLLNLSCHF